MSKSMKLFNPENFQAPNNVGGVPPHVSTFQASAKGFGRKYLPGSSKRAYKSVSFSEAVELYRSLAEALPIGGKLVKKSPVIDHDEEARILKRGRVPRERLSRSVPQAIAKLKAMRGK